MAEISSPRAPRSFVRRRGRVTRGQARALRAGWPHYGLSSDKPLNFSDIFERSAPCYVEIGFGMGDALAALAEGHPEYDYIGIEVHEAGIGRLLSLIAGRSIGNLRILRGDAAQLLECCFENASLAGVLLFFPDPWPKKRHLKRRLVQPAFVEQVARRLAPGGRFQLATDWPDYARQMLEVIEAQGQFRNQAGAGRFMADRCGRPRTKFERRGERLGHDTFDLLFERL